MPTSVHARPLSHPIDWIPAGRHFVPVVDGLAAFWVRFDREPAGPVGITVHTDGRWVPASAHVAATAVERMVADPVGPRRAYGRYTGFCGTCGQPLNTSRARQIGMHPDCASRHQPLDTVDGERQRARRHVLDALCAAWAAAPGLDRVRALVNAGPVALEKLDTAIVRHGGGPAVGHTTITSRTDPRIASYADRLARRVSTLGGGWLPALFGWAGLDTARHLTADLACRRPTRHSRTRVDSPADAQPLLAAAAMEGLILYAHLSCEPGLLLTTTLATD